MLNLFLKGELHIYQPQTKWKWFVLSLIILVLDQVTKHWASSVLTYADPVHFLPYFNFTLLHNYGAAFGFLAEQSGWQRFLLAAIALIVSIFLMLWILFIKPQRTIEIAGLSLILGGAIGNLWDRIVLGYVVDFVDWFYISHNSDCLPFFYWIFSSETCHWPAFNIADAAIMLGASCLILDMFLVEPKTKSEKG